MIFGLPQALLLLIPVGLLLARQGLPGGFGGLFRATTLALLVVAFAQPTCAARGGGQDVVVVIDRSRSMPSGSDSRAEELLRNIESRAGAQDRVGIVTFGREARVERTPTPGAHFSEFQREVDGEGSDLTQALDAAGEILSPDREGRILIVSDGLTTSAETRVAARRLAERGVAADFRLLSRSATEGDVAVKSIDLPDHVAQEEPFQFSATIQSAREGSVSYVLRRGANILSQGTTAVHPGENRLPFRDRLNSVGVADYTLELVGLKDAVPENDRGRAVLRVTGAPRILLVRPDGRVSALARALQASELKVEVTAKAPHSMEELDGVGVVILENTPASALGDQGLQVLAKFVRDVGGGLLVTGGQRSFGEGGYHLSALDKVLPVSMELREEQRKSSIALGISMDRSGSMAVLTPEGRPKIQLAAEGAVGALKLLSKGDEAAVWAVDTKAHEIFPLTPVEWGLSLDLVASIQSEGGGIYIDEALRAAAESLAKSKKSTRHLILFADANDSEQPGDYVNIIAGMKKNAITISVIGMGKPTDSDAELLRNIARLGSGQIYFAEQVNELPRLFSEDTIVLARASFVDNPTGLSSSPDLAMLGAPEGHGLPTLGGYNLTYLRPRANVAFRTTDENAAPVLAFWQVGLGHAAAFTGEADGKFSGSLRSWDGFRSIFTRVVRQLMPPPESGEVLAKARREGDELHVTVEVDETKAAQASAGTASVVAGDGVGEPVTQALHWEDPHRLGARFPLGSNGSFFPLVQVGGLTVRVAPVALPYASEFAPRNPAEGRALLTEIAELTGGVERLSVDGLFTSRSEHMGRRPIAAWFVAFALGLALLEVAMRRLIPGGVPFPRIQLPRRAPRTTSTITGPVVGAATAPIAEVVPQAAPPEESRPTSGLHSALDQARERTNRRLK
jgi:uncharacterized membrane protein/Mg-chelatase subunit ChlD